MRTAYTLLTGSAEETRHAGELLATVLLPGDVLALAGDLGAGKTCLVQGIARGLGVSEPVTSPTFNILLVHPGTLPLYHFDIYRLENESELDDIDFFETVEGDGVSAIEWGDRFPAALPPDHLAVTIHLAAEGLRRFEVVPGGVRSRALAEAWHAACVAGGMGL